MERHLQINWHYSWRCWCFSSISDEAFGKTLLTLDLQTLSALMGNPSPHCHSFQLLLPTSGSSGLMKMEGIGPLPLSKGSTEGLCVLGWGTTAHQSDIAQMRLMIDIFSTENSDANNVT